MKTSPDKIREALKASREGLHLEAIAQATGLTRDGVRYNLRHRMGDAYIDHWDMMATPAGPRFVPVWCVVEVPPDMPKPEALPERIQPLVHATLKDMGRATTADIAETLGVDRRVVGGALRSMANKGQVKRAGSAPHKYRGAHAVVFWAVA